MSVRWSVFRIDEIVGAPSLVTTFTAVPTPWPHGFFLICISIIPSINSFTERSFCGDEGPFTCYQKDMHLFVSFINNFNAEIIYSIGSTWIIVTYTLIIATVHRQDLMFDHITTSLSVISLKNWREKKLRDTKFQKVTTMYKKGNKRETKWQKRRISTKDIFL